MQLAEGFVGAAKADCMAGRRRVARNNQAGPSDSLHGSMSTPVNPGLINPWLINRGGVPPIMGRVYQSWVNIRREALSVPGFDCDTLGLARMLIATTGSRASAHV